MVCKLLSIDESGKVSYTHPSKLFIISSAVLSEQVKIKIDKKMRKLKSKFFNNENIVFHSREMIRKKGEFSSLNDKKNETAFWSEFLSYITSYDISFIFIITDKNKARKKGWHSKTILQRAYVLLLEKFVDQLKISGAKGKILAESDPAQDHYLIRSHNRLQSMGTTNKSVSAYEYKQTVTSISLVNKENNDIDIQIADALAVVAGMKYEIEILKSKKLIGFAEKARIRLINRKLADKKNPSFFEVLL